MDDPRKLAFVDRYEPPLEAGTYELTVAQEVEIRTPDGNGGTVTTSETYANVRRLHVRGERFALDAGEVVAVFPPDGSTGDHSAVLPHVVFERRTLPWERPPGDGLGGSWLAVLLLTEDEARQAPVRAASAAELRAERLPQGTVSCATASAFALEPGEADGDPCRVIDLPADLFARIAPKRADLPWLAHARVVPAGGKTSANGDPTLARSVVVGNRLPAAGTSCVCHLVSLEGLAGYLPDAPAPPAFERIRLVSLNSWSFTCTSRRRTFSSYFLGDAHGDAPMSIDALRLPRATADSGDLGRALDLGYVAFTHETRFGDRTVSWYRGPLAPCATDTIVPPPDAGVVLETADAAVCYDPATRMLDVSYAAAWEMGRLLALGNRSFSVSLAAWKKVARLKTTHAVATQTIAARFAQLVPEGREAAGAAEVLATLAPRRSKSANAPASTAAPASGTRLVRGRALLDAVTGLTKAELNAIHADTEVPDDLASWLHALAVLAPVPVSYLVPSAALLPPESVRFFILDANWINALLEGATSIGRTTSLDLAHDHALAGRLYEAAAPSRVASGFLLQSAVVEGWPGLEVAAFDERGAVIGAPPASARLAADAPAGSTALVVGDGETTAFPDPDPPRSRGGTVAHFMELTITPAPEPARCTAVSGGMLTLERSVPAASRHDLEAGDEIDCEAGRVTCRIRAAVPAAATSVTVDVPADAVFPDTPFEIVIRPAPEIVRCTAIADVKNTFTLARATPTGRAYVAGDTIALTSPRLRFERLGPSLLLFMTTGTLDEVHIHEPGEGLHFGFDVDDAGALSKPLRSAEGMPLPGARVDLRAPLASEARTVDMDGLEQEIRKRLAQLGHDGSSAAAWTSAQFALQLVEGVQSVRITAKGAAHP